MRIVLEHFKGIHSLRLLETRCHFLHSIFTVRLKLWFEWDVRDSMWPKHHHAIPSEYGYAAHRVITHRTETWLPLSPHSDIIHHNWLSHIVYPEIGQDRTADTCEDLFLYVLRPVCVNIALYADNSFPSISYKMCVCVIRRWPRWPKHVVQHTKSLATIYSLFH